MSTTPRTEAFRESIPPFTAITNGVFEFARTLELENQQLRTVVSELIEAYGMRGIRDGKLLPAKLQLRVVNAAMNILKMLPE